MERLRERYGKRFTVQLPFQPPMVMLSDPDDIRELFTAAPDVLHPGEGARVLEPTVGPNSVILLDEGPHLEQRKLLLPAFHGERMQRLTGLMSELTERELAAWPRERPLALHPRLQRLTLEIILRAVFGLEQGHRLDDLRDRLTQLLTFAENPLSVLPAMRRYERWIPPLRRFNGLLAQTDQMIFELVEERRRENGAGDEARQGENSAAGKERVDVLAMLLGARHEDGSPMSDREIRDELVTALVAGHETTASQLAWTFDLLSRAPAVVGRLVEELDTDGDEYLTATIYEGMRLRPVLSNAEPRLTMRPVEIGGFHYPAGVLLMANGFLVHRDPEIYPEPYAFRPERFLDNPPGTYTWIPFGGGRRRCLGASFALQEMKVVLRAVLARCELAPAGRRPGQTRRRGITFSPADGATVVLRDRAAAPVAGPGASPAATPDAALAETRDTPLVTA
jgi:cytochrome P450